MIKIHLDFDPPTATAQQKKIRVLLPKHNMDDVRALWGNGPGMIHKILRLTFPQHFKSKECKAAEQLFSRALARHVPEKPIEGAICLEVDWVFPYRKGEPKKITSAYSRIPKTTKPDASNLTKALGDVMTELDFWGDDAQVYDERSRKFWGHETGIFITIIHGDEVPGAELKEGDLFSE